jgi:hypothetical protein
VPISRRLRFEILRRDNFACRYCGATAPDAPLTVDHVIPVALGGGDEPNNLVTACADCNSGKASVPPDAEIVADVDAAALLWARAMERAAAVRRSEMADLDAILQWFDAQWQSWRDHAGEGDHLPRPANWSDTIERFLESGLSWEELGRYTEVAMRSRANPNKTWNYFCGCAWKEIGRRQELARRLIEDEEV